MTCSSRQAIEIAGLRSGECAKIMYWTQSHSPFESPALTHTAGPVTVKPLKPAASLDSTEFLMGMALLLGVVALALVLGYSLHPNGGAGTRPTTQATTTSSL
jgi:hypothetical protein